MFPKKNGFVDEQKALSLGWSRQRLGWRQVLGMHGCLCSYAGMTRRQWLVEAHDNIIEPHISGIGWCAYQVFGRHIFQNECPVLGL